MLLRSGCPLRLTARLRTPCAAGLLENCEYRNSFEVSQSCGLKNDLLCSRPPRAQQPLVQQTSSGPAVTRRTVNELLRQSPLCQVGSATFPEDFTCPVSLGDTDQCYWTSGRLHLSRHTGRASTTGRQKPSLVLSHWTGQDDWTSYKQPEAFTG